MNRHLLISLITLGLGSSCKGTEGNIFLDKTPVNGDAGNTGGNDSSVAVDTGGNTDEDASADHDGSFVPDGGSQDFDGSIFPDGGQDFDGSVDPDGGVSGDGGLFDTGVPGVDCTQNPPVFPSFDRSCFAASDCAIGTVQIDCCGTLTVTGINLSEEQRFAAAAALCNSQFPACGCPTQATSADDGTREGTFTGPAIVQCVANTCQTTFPPNPTDCGGTMSCNPFTDICVSTAPIGPSIQYACEPIPPGCEQNRTCSCAAGVFCSPPFDTCIDSGPNQIGCECLQCQ